jgi:hypothetical protein
MPRTNLYPYPFIRAYGRLVHSNASYISDEVQQAQRSNAPADAWSYDTDAAKWRTIRDLEVAAATGNVTAADTLAKLDHSNTPNN